jgi:hypothetical protein
MRWQCEPLLVPVIARDGRTAQPDMVEALAEDLLRAKGMIEDLRAALHEVLAQQADTDKIVRAALTASAVADPE